MEGRTNYGRPPGQHANGAMSAGQPGMGRAGPPSMPASSTPAANMTRAERFEDERKRIIESCFSKMDGATGVLQESYITHIRVEEDAAYPQTPPPPEAPNDNKKPRIIVVAVRNSGRVRMHKGRENSNGTFSIGKTWNLDDLTAIQSYSHLVPKDQEEALHKEWAGDRGFAVTLVKPYYWQAWTAKEKDFFIGSLVKIYRKYTKGRVPELVGFSEAEIQTFLGPPSQRGAGGPDGRSPPPPRPPPPGTRDISTRPSPEPMDRRMRPGTAQSNRPPTAQDDRGEPMSRQPSSQAGEPMTRQLSGQPGPGMMPRAPPVVEALRQSRQRPSNQNLRQMPSRDQMPPPSLMPGSRPPSSREQQRPYGRSYEQGSSVDSSRLTPQSSRSEFDRQRPESPETSSLSSQPPSLRPGADSPALDLKRSFEEQNRPPVNGLGISQSTLNQWRPNGAPQPPQPPQRTESPYGTRQQKAPSLSGSTTSSLAPTDGGTADDDGQNRLSGRKPIPLAKNSPLVPPPDLERSLDGAAPSSLRQPPRQNQVRPQPSTDTFSQAPTPSMPGAFASTPEPPEPVEEKKAALPVRTKSPEPVSPLVTEETSAPKIESTENVVSPVESPGSKEDEEQHRPGLGPMIKNKAATRANAANILRKAATAAGAFKPRVGGAGERLRLLKEQSLKQSDEPDGITGVVPAPGLLRRGTDETPKTPISPISPTAHTFPITTKATPEAATPERKGSEVPEVKVSSPVSDGPSPDSAKAPVQGFIRSPSPEHEIPNEEEIRKARQGKRRSDQQMKYLSALGIAPTILDGRGMEFESILNDFGWGGEKQANKVEMLEVEIKKEIGRVEAGSWLMSGAGERDERVEQVEKLLDRAIKECDELEGLLTLYSVELSSLNEDISFIEAQSQGLQVQTANQKLLQTELQTLVETISVTSEQLEPLRRGAIGSKNGLREIEDSLVVLYRAMITIDPNVRRPSSADGRPSTGYGTSELATMRALQEKRDDYLNESSLFLQRLTQFMDMTFGAALMNTKDALSKTPGSTKLDPRLHDVGRDMLWQYSPEMLFAKEIDSSKWDGFLKMYQARARPVYQEELRDNFAAWKRLVRKPTGDEGDLLFTSQEKENEGITNTARKLTVKRSQTLAKSLRSASGEKAEREKQSGKLYAFETFSRALEEMRPIIFTEQNFIVDFFHATSAESMDFVEAVMQAPPERRIGTNLEARKLFEADRAMAKKVAEVMEDIYATWPNDLQNMVEWAIKSDPLQGVGILSTFDRHLTALEETNQDFLTRTLLSIQTRLSGLFTRFVDEQVRAIEDTKVKIKKRKGVIGFIKTFPAFCAAIENMLPAYGSLEPHERNDTRTMVDEAYGKINKAMFESLKVIAKEAPGAVGAGADPEDKEALNYHILLIENMNHYTEEVDDRGDLVLSQWKANAQTEGEEHLTLYVDAVIRRPLGRVLDFLDQSEPLLSHNSGPRATATSSSALKKLLSSYDSKELRRGVEALKKRVDKHFGDADDPGLSRNLVARVLKACEAKYADVVERVSVVQREVFSGEEMSSWWGVEDVSAAFRR